MFGHWVVPGKGPEVPITRDPSGTGPDHPGRARAGETGAVRVVVALGGNALVRGGATPVDPMIVEAAARSLAPIAAEHAVVVTHGNGPQVGFLAETDPAALLDVLDAETEGMVGYLLVRALGDALPGREIVGVLTRVEIEADDPAFARPAKPIGRGPDRRLVASPLPRRIVEAPSIERLVAAGVVVVAAGGGGIPVVRRADGTSVGVEAVVDKDRASALLARELGADALLLLTDVDGVYEGWGTPAARRLPSIDASRAAALALDEGSMGPKVEAALDFADAGGWAAIGALTDAAAVLRGDAGTRVVSVGRGAGGRGAGRARR
jgi:carbamate kinase